MGIKSSNIKRSLIRRTWTTAKLSSQMGFSALRKVVNAQDKDSEKAIQIAIKLADEVDGMKGLDFGCVKIFPLSFITVWKEMAASILEDDFKRFREKTAAMGLVGNPKAFDFDHL